MLMGDEMRRSESNIARHERRYSGTTETDASSRERAGPPAPILGTEDDEPADRRTSPKAVRERRSLFSRSNSSAQNYGVSPTLHATVSSQSDRPMSPPPHTSAARSAPVQRKTEPLDNFRTPFFGRRRKFVTLENHRAQPKAVRSRPGPAPTHSREQFHAEEDYYRYLKKLSISPPFNFQHVAHTKRSHLPKLETVNENDLKAEFWIASAYQRPRRHLHGIKADDLDDKHRDLDISRSSTSSRPSSPSPAKLPADRPRLVSPLGQIASADAMVSVEGGDITPDGALAHKSFQAAGSPSRLRKRYSSLGSLPLEGSRNVSQHPDVAHESIFQSQDGSVANQDYEVSMLRSDTDFTPRAVSGNMPDVSAHFSGSYSYDAEQASPPLPRERFSANQSKSSLRPANPASASTPALSTYTDVQPSTKCRRSSLSIPASSSATCSKPDFRGPSIIFDSTWEDDVDFCYQQEAESTCDFNWDELAAAQKQSPDSDGGVRLSNYSPLGTKSRRPASFARKPGTADTSEQISRCSSVRPSRPRSSILVGHRAFQEARKDSEDLRCNPTSGPQSLGWIPAETQGSIPSPVLSSIAVDEIVPKEFFSPNGARFLGIEAASVDYLSDPESCLTGGSKHRKSSSYGSYESIARAANANRETARSSVGSSTSIPELKHSRRKSKSSYQKVMISGPLESLPQSPNQSEDHEEEDSGIMPPSPRTGAIRNSFVMRRPQTADDRAALLAVGRAVQRGRSQTPHLFSRLLHGSETTAQPLVFEETTWI